MPRLLLKDYDWSAIQASYDSGKSWNELCEIYNTSTKSLSKASKLGLFNSLSRSDAMVLNNQKYPRQFSDTSRQIMSDHAKRRGLGGQNFGRQIIYNGIALDSSYELKMAEELDANGISWTRPAPLPWTDDTGVNRKYYPDFYLSSYNVYLDPKNPYLMEKDARKIALVQIQNNVVVVLLSEKMLTWSKVLAYIEAR